MPTDAAVHMHLPTSHTQATSRSRRRTAPVTILTDSLRARAARRLTMGTAGGVASRPKSCRGAVLRTTGRRCHRGEASTATAAVAVVSMGTATEERGEGAAAAVADSGAEAGASTLRQLKLEQRYYSNLDMSCTHGHRLSHCCTL